MEKSHRTKLTRDYNHVLRDKKIITLNIPDNYPFMDEELIQILTQKCSRYLPEN